MTSIIGRTINGRYRLESLIGDGGMGTVYRASDINLDRAVAIKLMHSHFARQPEFRARLVQEAKTAAMLDHPSVVRIYDFGEWEEGLFIAMEYVDGGSLREHLQRLQRQRKFLPLAQSLQIAAQIADALHYAHTRGIVHRDVKPGNIILKRLGQPDQPNEQPFRAVLTDFGLVKLQEGTDMTQSGVTLGTPMYMSPEQCEGHKLDGRSDLYGLGVVLYELITNQLPFSFQTLSEAINTHMKGTMPRLASDIRGDAPKLLDTLLYKALAKSAAERYANGTEMSAALRSAIISLEGAPTRVMPRQEVDILEQVNEPPPGYELHIETPGQPVSVVPLMRPVITIGRNVDNDIVLPTDGVSRHHTRLQATSLGWEVIDLGGVNGTWLDDLRLRINAATPMRMGSRLRIGPYHLVLRGPEIAPTDPRQMGTSPGPTTPGLQPVPPLTEQATAVSATTPTTPAASAAATTTNDRPATPTPLGIFLPRDRVPVEPGQRVEFKIEVVNRSPRDDRVSLQVQGLPGDWIETSGEFVDVPSGKTVPLSLFIRPPRQRSTPGGRQRFRLELVSQQYPDLQLGTTASLMVGTYVAFEAGLDVAAVKLPARVVVSIQNTGNGPGEFSLVARDRNQALRFQGERGRIRLQPGQTANVDLDIEARSPKLWSGSELHPFEVMVRSGTGGQQSLNGEAYTGSMIPPTFMYGLVFLVTFACVIAILALATNRDRLFGPADTLTATPTFSTGLVGTETAVAALITPSNTPSGTITAVPGNDTDGDGLSDAQETDYLHTDPNRPDSDGDGLTDGEEALGWGSNPLLQDSDGDVLTDWQEVKTYATSPIKKDTDGDGVDDGREVVQGTDPLMPDVPTAVPSPTTTTTLTPTPGPSATPSITPSPTWTLTPAPSATATQTPTPTPSLTPSQTPSITPTPTITLTPTNTPMPNPNLTCAATPPIIDGLFTVTEWPGGPMAQFQPGGNPAHLVQVYFSRDANNLYLAFLVNDNTPDATDSVRLLFDATNNGGDPDSADRYFQIGRDGTTAVSTGIGSNSDTQLWNSGYVSPNWLSAISGQTEPQWVVEVQITATNELPALTNPFAVMIQVLYTGEIIAWPEGAVSALLDSWQDVNNVVCP